MNYMMRRDELLKAVEGNEILEPLIERLLFVESQLEKLEKLPMIRVNPKNPEIQKTTPAAKMYKEYLQQYINCLKTIEKAVGTEETEGESPLRRWINARNLDA